MITVSQHFRYLTKIINSDEKRKVIKEFLKVRYCAELMINSSLLTYFNSWILFQPYLKWYFLKMTQPKMLYIVKYKNSCFSFGWIWLLLGRQRLILVMSFGGYLWLIVGAEGWLCDNVCRGYIWLFVAVFWCSGCIMGILWYLYSVNGCVGGVFWSSDVF